MQMKNTAILTAVLLAIAVAGARAQDVHPAV